MESLYDNFTRLKPQNSFEKEINDLQDVKTYVRQKSLNIEDSLKCRENREFYTRSLSDETIDDEAYVDYIKKSYQTKLKPGTLSKYMFNDSVIPPGDPKHYARKSAFYNRTDRLEAHCVANFQNEYRVARLTEELNISNKSEDEILEEIEKMEDSYCPEKIIEKHEKHEKNEKNEKPVKTEKNEIVIEKTSPSIKTNEVEEINEAVIDIIDQSKEKLDKFIVDLDKLEKISKKLELPTPKDEKKEPVLEIVKMKDVKKDVKDTDVDNKSHRSAKENPYENYIPTENDQVSVFHKSRDRNFMITGTIEGLVNIWVLSSPHIKTEFEDLDDNEEFDPKNKKILKWTTVEIGPDLTFKAHESPISSVHIMPKSFESDKIDHVLVTTSHDDKVKVWKLSNLCDISNEREFKNVPGSKNKKQFRKRNKKVKIDLLGHLELKKTKFVEALYISVPNEILVTSLSGTIEKFKLVDMNNGKRRKSTKNNLVSVAKVTNQGKCITAGSISKGHNYYAIGTEDGEVKVYDVKNLDLLASFVCRNNKGPNKDGKEVCGIEWNRKENFILVTTKDSRIRLLSLSDSYDPSETSELTKKRKILEFLEKFKGHVNKRKPYRARFLGTYEEFVICPCETGRILVWCISAPGYFPPGRVEEKVEYIELPIKNKFFVDFRIKDKYLLDNLNIYNLYEWVNVYRMINDYNKELENPDQQEGCLAFIGHKDDENKDINPGKDILLVSVNKENELKYSAIDIKYFK